MIISTDQLYREVRLENPPKRIISLVPSQTELLFSLGLDNNIVGRTKFCVHPNTNNVPVIGGTKNLNLPEIHTLAPDLIIANKEENNKDDIMTLSAHYPVWVSDVNDLQSALQMIKGIGVLTNTTLEADRISEQIDQNFKTVIPQPLKRALYFIWRKPWMVAGNDTFISEMMRLAGFKNIVNMQRYPMLEEEEMFELNPEVILLSSEPFPFKKTHQTELQKTCPNAQIIFVNGEMFSWYGSRMLLMPDYFKGLH